MKLLASIGFTLILAFCLIGFIVPATAAAGGPREGPGIVSFTDTGNDNAISTNPPESLERPENASFGGAQSSGDFGVAVVPGWSLTQTGGNPQPVGPWFDSVNNPLAASTRLPGILNTFWWNWTDSRLWWSGFLGPYEPYTVGEMHGMRNPLGAVSDDRDRIWVLIPEMFLYGNDIFVTRWTPGGGWTKPVAVPPHGSYRCRSNTGPSAAAYKGMFMMAWTNAEGHVKYVTHTGSSPLSGWSGIHDLGNPDPYNSATEFTSGPVVCQYENYWWIFARDQNGDIRSMELDFDIDDPYIISWRTIPGSRVVDRGSISAVSRNRGHADIFYRRASDSYIVSRKYDWYHGWSEEEIMDWVDQSDSDPVAVSWSPYRIDLFWHHSDLQVYHKEWNTWGPYYIRLSPSYKDFGTSLTIDVSGLDYYSNSKVQVLKGLLWSDLPTSYVDIGSLHTIIPADLPAGVYPMRVTAPDDGWIGYDMSGPSTNFTVHNQPPTISGTNPSSVGRGTQSLSLAVVGTNYLSGTNAKVTVDGVERSGCTWDSSTSVHVPLTAADLDRTGLITLYVKSRNADDTWETSNGWNFNIVERPPTITSISPKKARHGTKVTISNLAGTGFQTGATFYLEKAGKPTITPLTIDVVSPTKITGTVRIPRSTKPGLWDVVVRNPDRGICVKAKAFRVLT